MKERSSFSRFPQKLNIEYIECSTRPPDEGFVRKLLLAWLGDTYDFLGDLWSVLIMQTRSVLVHARFIRPVPEAGAYRIAFSAPTFDPVRCDGLPSCLHVRPCPHVVRATF